MSAPCPILLHVFWCAPRAPSYYMCFGVRLGFSARKMYADVRAHAFAVPWCVNKAHISPEHVHGLFVCFSFFRGHQFPQVLARFRGMFVRVWISWHVCVFLCISLCVCLVNVCVCVCVCTPAATTHTRLRESAHVCRTSTHA